MPILSHRLTKAALGTDVLREQTHLQCAFEDDDQKEKDWFGAGIDEKELVSCILRNVATSECYSAIQSRHLCRAMTIQLIWRFELRRQKKRKRVVGTSQPVSISFLFHMQTISGPLPYNRPHEVGHILYNGIIAVCLIHELPNLITPMITHVLVT